MLVYRVLSNTIYQNVHDMFNVPLYYNLHVTIQYLILIKDEQKIIWI